MNNNVLKALAGNPNTSEEVLIYLSKNKCSEVRSLVARNPSSPREALMNLKGNDIWYMTIMSWCKIKLAWLALKKRFKS